MTKALKRVLDQFKIDTLESLGPEVRRLISAANHDLYFGPMQAGDTPDDDQNSQADSLARDGSPSRVPDEFVYPGFVIACEKIHDALQSLSTIYVDSDAETYSTTHPEEFEEYIYTIDRKFVLKVIVGKELVDYIS